jgi:regulatory protein
MATRSKPGKRDAEDLWNYALRVLGRRAHSVHELKEKLARVAKSTQDLEATLAKLREYRLADDRKFSEAFATARLQNQGFGRFRVLRDLQSKRVASATARNAVENAFSGIDEEELVQQFLRRKYRAKDLSQWLLIEKNLAAAYRRLRSAGFTSKASLAVLRRYTRRVEEWGDVEEVE